MKQFAIYITCISALMLPFWGEAQSSNDKDQFAKLDSMAFHYYESNSPKAEDYANLIIEKSKNLKPSLYLANAYTLLGIINKNRGYYITSLEKYIHALNISEKLKDTGRVSACLNNIGIIYKLQNNLQQAINYFSRSLELEEKLNNPLQKSIRYYNLGDCYKDLKRYDDALSYFNNSLLIENKFKNEEGISYAYLGIAEVYLGINRLPDAKMVLDKIQNRLGPTAVDEKILYKKLLGSYFIQSDQVDQAIPYLKEAENISLKNQNSSHLRQIYLLQIEVYNKKQDYRTANQLYEKYIKLNDELSNSEIKNKIEDITYQNELSKKELEIKLVMEERNLAKKNEIFEKNLRLYEQKITWFVVLILIISVSVVFYGIRKLTQMK